MSVFVQTATQIINDYKRLLSKLVSATTDRQDRLKTMRLKRKDLRSSTEVDLYIKIKDIIADLENWQRKSTRESLEYSGLENFIEHVKSSFNEFRLTSSNKVVHGRQKASCALIEAVQLMSMPDPKLTSDLYERLDQCSQIIAKFGTQDQQIAYNKALQVHRERNASFFHPLVDSFKRYLSSLRNKDVAVA